MFILILVCLFFYLFIYVDVYFLHINIFFVIYLTIFLFTFTFIYIYIYLIIQIIFLYKIVKENATNKSTKLRARWNNLCMLDDFKEDNKIVFEADVNIPNNEIWVIRLLGWILFVHNCLLLLIFIKKLCQFVDTWTIYLSTLIIYVYALFILILVCLNFFFIHKCWCLFLIY